jgi:AraC family transcriptional regulator
MLGKNCYIGSMQRDDDASGFQMTAASRGPPDVFILAQGRDWCVREYVCNAGPGDRAFEERHACFTIAAVVEGSFNYRADTGTSLLHPGAFLLGNHGACFECGHDHSKGDRCIAFHFEPEYFAEIAASAAGTARFTFPTGMLPALPMGVPWLARTQARIALGQRLEIDEAISQLIELVLGNLAGITPSPARISATDERRMSTVLGHIEQHATDALDLDQLSTVAAMSKYHFLRTFRRTVGITPYQFLLSVRMRRAAVRLLMSSEPVSSIAFDVGFGDLSTFNCRFRAQFGASPTAYRARERTRSQ